jgi:hypothetical protein
LLPTIIISHSSMSSDMSSADLRLDLLVLLPGYCRLGFVM